MVVADVLLWKNWYGGVVGLVSATTLWCLFEVAGYNPLSFVANVLLLLVVILFFWAKSASLLNRYFSSFMHKRCLFGYFGHCCFLGWVLFDFQKLTNLGSEEISYEYFVKPFCNEEIRIKIHRNHVDG
jgi:FtsH-binding integral membrane protein